MAIKIECSNCGCQNDLGRVFCAQCGVKLDLQATSAGDLKERRQADVAAWVRRTVASVAMLVLILIVGTALWPDRGPAVLMDPAGAVQVPIKAKAVRAAVSYNQPAKLDLTEGELNGFFKERAKSRKLDQFTIDLTPGGFSLYAVQTWTPPEAVPFLAKINIPFSLGLKGSFQSGVMITEGVYVGHLPLPGFSRGAVISFFAGLFEDIIREKRVVQALKSVAIEETRADLKLEP